MLHLSKIDEMIQRVQSLYLLIILFLSLLVFFVFPISSFVGFNENEFDSLIIIVKKSFDFSPILIAGIALFELLMFKNRGLQMKLGLVSMLVELYLIGAISYVSLSLPGESLDSEKGILMLYPLVCLVLNAIANKAIKKDEDLVKSVDRIR